MTVSGSTGDFLTVSGSTGDFKTISGSTVNSLTVSGSTGDTVSGSTVNSLTASGSTSDFPAVSGCIRVTVIGRSLFSSLAAWIASTFAVAFVAVKEIYRWFKAMVLDMSDLAILAKPSPPIRL